MRGIELIREDIREVRRGVEERPTWQDVKRMEAGLTRDVMSETKARGVALASVNEDIEQLKAWNKYAVTTAVGLLATVLAAWLVSLIV